MAERDDLVAAVTAEVLGPRNGIREVLEAPPHRSGQVVSPLDEYITGVLAPRDADPAEEIDASGDLLGAGDESADDQSDAGAPASPLGVGPTSGIAQSPSLDPRSRPCSIGLSVTVEGDRAEVDVCATWGVYSQSSPGVWQRKPYGHLWRNVDCTQPRSRQEVVCEDGER